MYSMPMSQGRQLPQICFREIDFPEIVKSQVGDKYYVVMKVELVGKRAAKSMGIDNGNDGNKMEGEFQVLSVKKLGNESVDSGSLEKKEYQDFATKVKSGNLG